MLIVSLDEIIPGRLLRGRLPAHGASLLEELNGEVRVDVGDDVLGADLQTQIILRGIVTVDAAAVGWPIVRHGERARMDEGMTRAGDGELQEPSASTRLLVREEKIQYTGLDNEIM